MKCLTLLIGYADRTESDSVSVQLSLETFVWYLRGDISWRHAHRTRCFWWEIRCSGSLSSSSHVKMSEAAAHL